ncbi:hypothetical protein OG301_20230 [Streptomyces platensis]|uniref:hypothetical protein n=1 Tax=Streptomyces platensis TaxID=58346 RepID=UPI002ED1201C|nr:hypothetical protein OG301_20230 [Streptomyces platensis]
MMTDLTLEEHAQLQRAVRELTARRTQVARDQIWRHLSVVSSLTEGERRRVQAAWMRARRRDLLRSGRAYVPFSVFLAAIAITGYSIFLFWLQITGEEEFLDKHPRFTVTILVGTLGAALNAFVAFRFERLRDFASPHARRSDLLLNLLVLIVSEGHTVRYHWWQKNTCRRLRNRIDSAARDIAVTRVRIRRTEPLADHRVRNDIRIENKKLAEVLRNHSRALARAGSQADYEKILESLTRGLMAASRDDWDALLDGAPEITRRSVLARALARLGPAMLLLGTAAALPLIPAFSESAEDIRKFLVPMGIIAALGASETVANSIRGVLDKVVFGSK